MKESLRVCCLIICLLPFTGMQAQEVEYDVVRGTYFRVYAGLSITKLNHDTLDLGATSYPHAGMDFRFRINDQFSILTGAELTFVGGQLKQPVLKLRNQYARAYFMPRYRIKDLFDVQAGVAYAYLMKSEKKELDGSTANGSKLTPITDYDSQVELALGVELPLSSKVDFGVMFFAPLTPANEYFSLEFNLRYRMNY